MSSCLDQLKPGDVIEFYIAGTINPPRHRLIRTFSYWTKNTNYMAVTTLDGTEHCLETNGLVFTKIIKRTTI